MIPRYDIGMVSGRDFQTIIAN